MESDFNFPQYRKYQGRNTWFEILSLTEFVEISFVGEQKQTHIVKAEKFPEKLMISDMLACKDGRWEEVSKNDFVAIRD